MSKVPSRPLQAVIVAGLVIIGALLGLRSLGAVKVVLETSGTAPAEVASLPAGLGRQAALLAERDSLLEASVPGERDPFRDPPRPRRPRAPAPKPRRALPKPAQPPMLRALLFDNVDPGVQLSLGKSRSDWLHVGDTFEGWTVVEITATSVRVTKGGESFLLP